MNFNFVSNDNSNPFQPNLESQDQKQIYDDDIYDEPCIRCGCMNPNSTFQLTRIHKLKKIDLCTSCFMDIQKAKVFDHRLPNLWIVAKTFMITDQSLGRVAFNSIQEFNQFCKNLQNSQIYQYGVYIKSENWPMKFNWLNGDDTEDIHESNNKYSNIFWLLNEDKHDYTKILEAFDLSFVDSDNDLRDILFDCHRMTYITDSFFSHCEAYIKNVQTTYCKFKSWANAGTAIPCINTNIQPFNFTMTD